MELGGALGIDSNQHCVQVFGTVLRGHFLQATAQGGIRALVRKEELVEDGSDVKARSSADDRHTSPGVNLRDHPVGHIPV